MARFLKSVCIQEGCALLPHLEALLYCDFASQTEK
jgi:hypothetical protein